MSGKGMKPEKGRDLKKWYASDLWDKDGKLKDKNKKVDKQG